MMGMLKEKAISSGMKLLNSPAVGKVMESEQMGKILEKAMTLPIKISDQVRDKKEKVSSFMELATQTDLDELKRSLARMEDELRSIRNEKK